MSDDDLQRLLDSLTEEERQAAILAARHDCWRRGDLSYKVANDPEQARLWNRINSEPEVSRWVLKWSRKRGKSFFMVAKFAELAQQHRKKRLVFGAPTLKHLEEFILPLLDEVSADAPDDVKPVYEPSTGHWFFPSTKSWVHFFGADDKRKADRGRGPAAIVAGFDECGFTPVLNYVLSSIFRPSMLHGALFTILGSTPPPEPDHDFIRICEVAEQNGTLSHQTIYDNPRLSPEQVQKFIEEDARDNGMTVAEYVASTAFRREYLAEDAVDTTLMAMGDDWQKARDGWTNPEKPEEVIPRALIEWPRPQFFDAYECIDFGGADPRACLFGFYDFASACLVIEDEVNLRNNENTAQLADAIKAKERELYGAEQWDGTLRAIREEKMDERLAAFLPRTELERIRKAEAAPLQPYLRIADHDLQSVVDLWTLHGLAAIPADKGELAPAVNETRVAFRQGRIKVSPRCRDLDRQLRTSEWTSPRATDFKRKNGEHADLLWCLVRLWQNVRKGRNPTPANFGVTDPVELMIRKARQRTPWAKLAAGR